MPITSPQVSFGLYALALKQDSTPTAADIQPASIIADLINDNVATRPFATWEPDFWLLDGNYKMLPGDGTPIHEGWVSLSMSDGSGTFAVSPVLTINFTQPETSDSLTLHFSPATGDFASSLKIGYYGSSPTFTLLREDTYAPNDADFTTGLPMTGFQRIVITFYATSRPYRYLRLSGIDYGTLIYFTGSQVREAQLTEDIDPVGGEARYNTLDLKLYSTDGAFSILNPTGYYQYLQQRQPIAMHERIDNQVLNMGRFYLQKWENVSEREISFNCIDLMGVLEQTTYNGGFYTGVNAGTLIGAICADAGATYDLDASLAAATVTGWIPIGSHRAALQQIAFAVGAYLDCSRSSALRILPVKIATSSAYSSTLTDAQKGMSQAVALKPLVTGVEVTTHNYTLIPGPFQAFFNDTLAVGDHFFAFPAPILDLLYGGTGVSVPAWGSNFAILRVAGAPAVADLEIHAYIDNPSKVSVNAVSLPAGTIPNILKIENATLVSDSNGQTVAQRIYDYYQQRLVQKARLFASQLAPGDIVLVDTLYKSRLIVQLEKMTTDLTGGMISQVEMTGGLHA